MNELRVGWLSSRFRTLITVIFNYELNLCIYINHSLVPLTLLWYHGVYLAPVLFD
jgi:hypothetical protein